MDADLQFRYQKHDGRNAVLIGLALAAGASLFAGLAGASALFGVAGVATGLLIALARRR